MVGSGYDQHLSFADESLYGSADVVDQPIGLVQSVNPTETNNLIKVRTMGGSRDYSNIVPGKFEVSGSMEYYLQNGPFLRMAFGEDTATSATIDSGPKYHTGAATYQHCMGSAASPEADDFPSFTLEFTDAEDTGATGTNNLKRTYTGCRVNGLTISGSVDEPVKVSCDWIAQGVTVSTAEETSITQSTDDPFVFYQGAVYCTSAGVAYWESIATTNGQLAEVNGFDFSINNNLEATWYISGTTNPNQTLRGLKNLLVKGRDYEGNLNLHFRDKSMYQKFLGSNTATQSAGVLNKYQVVLDFVRSGTIGSDPKLAADDVMRFVLGSCAFDTINITGSPEDLVSESIGLSIESCKAFVVDTDSSYV